ncbi:MAG: Cys-tRNA(Pro) deacylase [Ruminococcaceae bacterium]|jgi:Cys-tRNA(Pro)/Cys-tRNA(Cys) deacylase|nr:Cys-tRNA(Pro) deacylase [Oscillospiraceae bacterium]
MKTPKTNAMRLLDRAGIDYEILTYAYDESDLSGIKAADSLGLPPVIMYKTIVMQGNQTGHMVGCVPVNQEIDLKALALLSGDKHIEMVPQKDLLPLTGYIRGGCSPLGMKKQLPSFIDGKVMLQEKIAVSAGKRGVQILLAPSDLIGYLAAKVGDFAR